MTKFTFWMENVLACLFFKLIFALSCIEFRHNIRHCQWENSFTDIHQIYNQKLKKKINETTDEKKTSKALEENKQRVTIKRLVWYFNFYRKFMCTVKNNNNKMNVPTSSFHSFLNCWKTASSTKTLKFLDF